MRFGRHSAQCREKRPKNLVADRLLSGRGLDEQLQKCRLPAAWAANSEAVAGQLGEAQLHGPDGALVADTHAIATMTDAASSASP